MSDEHVLVPLSGFELGKFKSSGAQVPIPFQEDIFLIKELIAGTSHLDDVTSVSKEIELGTRLSIVRETTNQYDDKAVLIKTSSGAKVGYIPRRKNTILANLLDAGKELYGTVDELEWDGGWLKIFIKVYMVDL
jgi:hypothetical protein